MILLTGIDRQWFAKGQKLGIVFCAFLLWAGFTALRAVAAETHTFSALHSLTGSCATSTADEVPDPGCPEGEHPPAGQFSSPSGVAVDEWGDVYVASYGTGKGEGGHVDVFNPEGLFLTEIPATGAREVAVDSEGHLYVYLRPVGATVRLLRFDPTAYEPASGAIAYGSPPTTVLDESDGLFVTNGIAISPIDDRLFVAFSWHINEYGSAAEGNSLLDENIGGGALYNSAWVAVDGRNGNIYASSTKEESPASRSVIKVFSAAEGHPQVSAIDGKCLPQGEFLSNSGLAAPAIEEGTGDVFVYDAAGGKPAVYEFTETGECVSKLTHQFQYVVPSSIAIDNGTKSPHPGFVYVPSGESTKGNLFAFEPLPEPLPPLVEALTLTHASATEASFQALIDPENSPTEYAFELVTDQQFQEEGFANATRFGEGTLPSGGEGILVTATVAGLEPETKYHVRLLAENECEEGGKCPAAEELIFATYGDEGSLLSCPNQSFRVGASAVLPDCRAYELVSPPDTAGHLLKSIGIARADSFGTPPASPDGEDVSFLSQGGSIPGLGGAGSFGGDAYRSTRTPGGWETKLAGPTGTETSNPLPGGLSPEHEYSFWIATDSGSLVLGKETRYVRLPDGTFELLGVGSLGVDLEPTGRFIAPGGSHIVFTSDVPLEPDAPGAGITAVYDRTEGSTHVVSLLPGDVTPSTEATYLGSSADGRAIAFSVAGVLYLRLDNTETLEVADGATFEGLSSNGDRIFYLAEGNLFAMNTATQKSVLFAGGGDVTPVNISADGTRAYFVSPDVLAGEENPQGEEAALGSPNLYVADGETIRFVATLTQADVEGELSNAGGFYINGLGLWDTLLGGAEEPRDPSRSTPDGGVLVFQSHAQLTGYDSQGHTEIYRYDAESGELTCLSCNPTLKPAFSDASLQSIGAVVGAFEPLSRLALVPNLRGDGKRVIFQSVEALVADDTDGLQDVYEWEAPGVGSCAKAAGCVLLISSGHSSRPDYLFGAGSSSEDIFISTSDLLLPADRDQTPSIYDARVLGGFAEEPAAPECEGEGCRSEISPPPALPAPGVSGATGSDNVGKRFCPRGRRAVKRHGRRRCVKVHRRARHRKHHARRGAR